MATSRAAGGWGGVVGSGRHRGVLTSEMLTRLILVAARTLPIRSQKHERRVSVVAMKGLVLAACLGLAASASPAASASVTPGLPTSPSPAFRGACAARTPDPALDAQVRRITALALLRLAAADTGPADRYPKAAYPGATVWLRSGPSDWTAGFYPGSLWYAYELTGDPAWAARAARWTRAMIPQATSTSHDIGFMLMASAGQQLRLAGGEPARTAVETAGTSLARHFVPGAGADTTWPSGSSRVVRVIIDSVMNLEVMLEAADQSGDGRLRRIADENARTLVRTHVRPDGSTWHVADLAASDGDVIDRFTAQGLSDDSTWARGQAWAVHGLTTAWRETGDPALLTGARLVADWWVSHVPAECVPYWDFDAPAGPRTARDASAAAVAASGLLELARMEPDAARATAYRGVALATIARLTSDDYTTATSGGPSILRREVYRNGEDVGAFAWGDYYLLEALSRLRTVAPVAAPLRVRALTASAGDAGRAGDQRWRTAWRGGPGAELRVDLGAVRGVSAVAVSWGGGAARSFGVDLATSVDGRTWSTVAHWRSSGRTAAPETLRIDTRSARFLRLRAGAGGVSVAEVQPFGP